MKATNVTVTVMRIVRCPMRDGARVQASVCQFCEHFGGLKEMIVGHKWNGVDRTDPQKQEYIDCGFRRRIQIEHVIVEG